MPVTAWRQNTIHLCGLTTVRGKYLSLMNAQGFSADGPVHLDTALGYARF
jgi:hypothetical protein